MKDYIENKSVAIVGNAMSLFDGNFGKDIDSHDIVIRLNRAAMLINRFDSKKSHGTKTDIWIFWSVREYYKYFDTKSDIVKIHAGHQHRTSNLIRLVDFVYPEDLYVRLKEKAGPRKNPTTGFIAIDYVLHCKPLLLSVYGFDWKKTPTHTDPDRKKEMRCPHNYEIEEEYCMEHVFTRSNVFLRNSQ
jgi:hypothetical protein